MKASYQIDTAENKAYVAQLAEELLQFGTRFPSPCGASFYLGDDGTPWKERPVETWITCRMAHVYSIGAMLHGADEAGVLYRKLAAEAIRGLLGDLKDTVNGGWYPGLTADGTILPEKQCYAHAFVILAASSGKLAGI
ncbi:MAG: AGE family epimerase/isomerase, partial [Lachnospiraceae bacterium]|nr:AGE family epimerase/isomerase [Lachnospiraceae bacterium]